MVVLNDKADIFVWWTGACMDIVELDLFHEQGPLFIILIR